MHSAIQCQEHGAPKKCVSTQNRLAGWIKNTLGEQPAYHCQHQAQWLPGSPHTLLQPWRAGTAPGFDQNIWIPFLNFDKSQIVNSVSKYSNFHRHTTRLCIHGWYCWNCFSQPNNQDVRETFFKKKVENFRIFAIRYRTPPPPLMENQKFCFPLTEKFSKWYLTASLSSKSNMTINQSCKNVPTVPTSRCYFLWPVLIFGKSTWKTANFWEKHAKNC